MILLASPGAPAEGRVLFTGKVVSIDLAPSDPEPAIRVHFDARWAVTIEVERAEPEVAPLAASARVIFAIHSPALTFGCTGLVDRNTIPGNRFVFRATYERCGERNHWRRLEVIRRVPGPGQPEENCILVCPYRASPARRDRILRGIEKLAPGMDLRRIHTLLGEPDEVDKPAGGWRAHYVLACTHEGDSPDRRWEQAVVLHLTRDRHLVRLEKIGI